MTRVSSGIERNGQKRRLELKPDIAKAEEIKDEQNSQPQRFSFQELVEMIEKGVEIPGQILPNPRTTYSAVD